MKQHRFVRESGDWYIDLPEYLEQGGNKGDLQMVSGADTMLNIIAEEKDEVVLQIDTNHLREPMNYYLPNSAIQYLAAGIII